MIDILSDAVVALPTVETDDPVEDIRTILLALWTSMTEPNRRSELVSTIRSSTRIWLPCIVTS